MLAEIKTDIKPEAAVADLNKQLTAFQERLQAQTVLPPKTTKTNEVSQPEEQVVNFGWEEVKEGIILPFVKRQTENYVANHIVAELVYKDIQKEFSNEMIFCMTLIMERMTKKEADTFNEININHCDRGIVGDHNFKQNDFMIKLDYVRRLVHYHNACRKLILHKIKDNKLFGFIAIGGNDIVPFIYRDSRQLVPHFYFEGPSEYLDARSIDLIDPFEIGYIKFCCKVQSINKNFYEQNPLKVVDLDDVKKLFPVETKFSIHIPEKINQELLAPEVRLALLHGLEEEVLQPVPENINILIPSTTSENSLNENNKQNENLQKDNDNDPIELKTLETEFRKYKEHMRLNKINVTKANKRSSQAVGETETKRCKIDKVNPAGQSNTSSTKENVKSSASLSQSKNTQAGTETFLQPQDMSRISQEYTVTPIQRKETYEQQIYSDKHVSGIVTSGSIIGPSGILSRSNREVQVTNVPYQSPPGASSPGLPQVTQDNEAAYRVSGAYSPVIDSYCPTTVGTTHIDPSNVNLHANYVANHSSKQSSYSNHDYVNVGDAQQHNNIPYSVANRSSNFGPNYKPSPVQVSSSQSSYYSKPNLENHNQDAWLKEQQTQQRSLASHSTHQDINIRHYRPQMQQPSSFPHSRHRAMQQPGGFSYHPGLIKPNQAFHSMPASNTGPYFQQNRNLSGSVAQTVNRIRSYTNNALSRNYGQNNYPDSATSANMMSNTNLFNNQYIDNRKYDNNNNAYNFYLESKTMVLEHPLHVHPNPRSYETSFVYIDNKLLLGISKFPYSNYWLVNLSEFVEKVLGLNPFGNNSYLLSRFTTIYNLNPIQQRQWDKVSQEKRVQFVGLFKDLFVDYKEIHGR